MPQILALEFNDTEARLVAASSRGERVVIDHAFSVTLLPRGPDEDPEQGNIEFRAGAGGLHSAEN